MLLEFQRRASLKSGDRVKYALAVVAAKNELRYRDPASWLSVFQARPQLYDSLWMWKWERAQQNSVNHAEYGRVGANAEREGENGYRGETWILAQHAQAKANIHEEVLNGWPLPDFAAVFFDQSHVAKFAASGGGGFFSGHAAGNEFLDLFFEMRLNLFGKIVEEAAARKQLFKPIHDSPGAKTRVVPSSIRSGRHSWRSATMGSTCIARRAGTKHASSATSRSRIVTPPNVSGSVGVTPKSSFVIKRVRPNDAPRPIAIPIIAIFVPCPRMSHRTSLRSAPRVRRTPISWVRCSTRYEITPYIPTEESTRATAANKARRIIEERCVETESETISSIASNP